MKGRKTTRLAKFDYSSPWFYFVTICTHNHEFYFGEIREQKMFQSPIGEKAHQYIQKIPQHFPNIKLDTFIIMPNHIHILFYIHGSVGVPYDFVGSPMEPQDNYPIHPPKNKTKSIDPGVGVQHDFEESLVEPRSHQFQKIIPKSIGSIIRTFKSSLTKWCRQNNHEYFRWQRSFHDRIIRPSKELNKIRDYIKTNIENWDEDEENLTIRQTSCVSNHKFYWNVFLKQQ